MKILAIGVNHKTAPVGVREKLAFDEPGIERALGRLKAILPEAEFAILSTCNRVELYAAGPSADVDADELLRFLARFHNVALRDFRDFVYVHKDENAARHLFRVASSLDSLVVGESQIIAQVKESFRLACGSKSVGAVLSRLFHCAFATAKKVHSCTLISSGRVSVPGVAVELARRLFADISSATVVVLGAGEMGQLLVQHLLHSGCTDLRIINRSYERGRKAAADYGVRAAKWNQLSTHLAEADIAIASADARKYLFTKDSLAEIMRQRDKGALLIIDIAVPRNFDPAVGRLDNVHLYSIDDLAEVVQRNLKAREDDIAGGMQIVYENAGGFMEWLRARDIGPMIGRMKAKFARIGEKELARFLRAELGGLSRRQTMEPMVHSVVNKLLHCVIQNVTETAKEHGPAEAARLVESIVQRADAMAGKPQNRGNI